SGDIIPIQIIDNRRLSGEENIWLKELDNELDVERISRITKAIDRLGKAAQIGVYLDAIARANSGILQEALKMSDTALTLERVFEEAGLIAKWEARGEEKKAFEVAIKLINKSWTPEEVADTTKLDVETVKSLYPQK
ncbi:MAG: glycoside hydrolase family 6 protein, partial [Treponema sp.]|nr:glycoside hydrolase family 6 protein [Treponema sp.]